MDHAIAIGCDCPDLTPELVHQAFALLDHHDLVIGPAHDGGYYLIGMTRRAGQGGGTSVFHGVQWGGTNVFAHTRRNAQALGLRIATLVELGDVDEPQDLPRWHKIRSKVGNQQSKAADRSQAPTSDDGLLTFGPPPPLVSVIIPTLNEAEHLPRTIAAARQSPNIEIIVADGGSTDGTPQLAQSLGARVIGCSPRAGQPFGRAVQMNAGAQFARSDVLLFLHADTHLPFGYIDDVQRIRHGTGDGVLAFRFAFDVAAPLLGLRLIERAANMRSRWLRLPYGDQALAIRRDTFERLGGFAPMPVMEDFEFVCRLRKSGRVLISDRAALTSARRWQRHGVWRTTLRHQLAIMAYLLGAPLDRVATLLGHDDRHVEALNDCARCSRQEQPD